MADTKDEPTETSEKHRDVQPGGGSSRGPSPTRVGRKSRAGSCLRTTEGRPVPMS